MNQQEKFLSFLEALKTGDNASLIENVSEGFKACHEAGMGIHPTVTGGNVAPIGSNLPSSRAPALREIEEPTDEEVNMVEVPDVEEPDMSQAPAEVNEKLKEDIFKLLGNPEFKDMIKEELIRMGEI